jgi:LuxR family maltose regulon positive regulatory protein
LSPEPAATLALGRRRASGQAGEIECTELAFDFREALSFLKANLDDAIDVDGAHLIHELTDGEPAHDPRGHHPPDAYAATFGGRRN